MADDVIKTVLTADDKEFRAAFDRAVSIIQRHEAKQEDLKKKSLARATAELQALRLEASGQKEAASALRETMTLKEKALALAKQTGLSEQASMVLLQKRMAMEKQVAAETARRSQPVSLSGLPVNNLQQLDKWNRVAAQSSKEMYRLRGGGQNAAMGLLEISRAAEDAQYGFRGVINNVPGIVQSFGGGAGIAGAVSLAVVAFYQLGKAYMAYLDSIDNQAGYKAGDAARDAALKAGRERLRVLREEEEIKASINAYGKEYAAILERELSVQKGVAEVIEGRLEQRRRERQYADEIATAQERLARARGESVSGGGTTESARLQEDLASQQELLKAINREAGRLDFARKGYREELGGQIEASQAEIEKTRDVLLETEARLSQAAEILKTSKVGRGRTNDDRNVKILTDERNRLQGELKFLEAKVSELRTQADTAESQSKAGMDAINARISATMGEIKVTKELIEQRRKLAEIESQVKEEERLNAELEKRKKLLEQAKQADKERLASAAEQQKVMQARTAAQVDFGGELKALRLEASGRKDMADALRSEMRIREEAADLAERTGISEERATALVREREQLMRQIREGERGATRDAESRIRRSARDTGRRIEAAGGRRIEAAGGRRIEIGLRPGGLSRSGLRESELARQTLEKAKLSRDTGEAKAAKYWERSINLQESLVEIFNKMGAI